LSRAASVPRFGPGALVAAAFVGPGTVTACSLAGAEFGTSLLFAVLFSVLATLILQEMVVRLALASGEDLSTALVRRFPRGVLRWATALLVGGAIVLGCAAYQVGNLLGARAGLSTLFPEVGTGWLGLLTVVLAGAVLVGGYRFVERALVVAVAVMSLSFAATAVCVFPALGDLLSGLFVPRLPAGSEDKVLALVGTTVVPYNLFLHGAAVRRRFTAGLADLPAARRDAAVFIVLGGAVSAAILVTAAGTFAATGLGAPRGPDELAKALEPLLGPWARTLFGAGLLAAGVTSAVTAPLAAGVALEGLVQGGRNDDAGQERSVLEKGTAAVILATGAFFLLLETRPLPAILLAQALNGLLLPLVAIFLLLVMNDRGLPGGKRNGWGFNLAGGAVVLLTAFLGLRGILSAVHGAFG